MENKLIMPEQGMLMDLLRVRDPAEAGGLSSVVMSQPAGAGATMVTTLTTVFEVVPDVVPGVILVDPRAILPRYLNHGVQSNEQAAITSTWAPFALSRAASMPLTSAKR